MIIRFDYEKLICDIEQFRKSNRLSKRAFAENSGVNVAIISRIIHKDYRPGANVVERIANAMGKTVLDYSIESIIVSDVYSLKYNKLTIEQLNEQIAKLVEIRNEKIRLELEKMEAQKKEINESITEYEKLLMNEDELL